jgi:hypothetical protein
MADPNYKRSAETFVALVGTTAASVAAVVAAAVTQAHARQNGDLVGGLFRRPAVGRQPLVGDALKSVHGDAAALPEQGAAVLE